MRLTTRRWVPPGRWSCPCATGRRPVGPSPRSGQVEMRLGPAWVRYRETATPETDPPSAFHRPVLIPGRHRARSSRLRVTLPRCWPCPWCPPAAMPTSPTYPARVRLRLRCPQVAAAQSQRGEEPAQESAGAGFLRLRCFIGSPSDGSRLPSQQPRGGICDAGRPCPTARPASEDPSLSPSGSVARPPLRPQHAESQDRAGRRPGTAPARLLDPAATYNTTLTALRSTDRPASACSCAADRAEFAPARPIAGGSGGRSQRSLP